MSQQFENPYLDEVIAGVYDSQVAAGLAAESITTRDVPLYLDYAERTGGPVLEVACGTGRIVLPLARAGHRVIGIDSSPHMLARARAKLAAEPEDVRQRVTLVEADMRSFQMAESFALVILAFNTFIVLSTPQEQAQFLETARRHLMPNGLLIIDVFIPDPAIVARPPGYTSTNKLFAWPERNAKVLLTEVFLAGNLAAQTREVQWIYEVIAADGQVTRHVVPLHIRHTYPQEMVYLLERCGFRIVERFGGWERQPLDENARRMIVVAARAG